MPAVLPLPKPAHRKGIFTTKRNDLVSLLVTIGDTSRILHDATTVYFRTDGKATVRHDMYMGLGFSSATRVDAVHAIVEQKTGLPVEDSEYVSDLNHAKTLDNRR